MYNIKRVSLRFWNEESQRICYAIPVYLALGLYAAIVLYTAS